MTMTGPYLAIRKKTHFVKAFMKNPQLAKENPCRFGAIPTVDLGVPLYDRGVRFATADINVLHKLLRLVGRPSKIRPHTNVYKVCFENWDLTLPSIRVPPATKVICLEIIVATENFTVSIPSSKMNGIRPMVASWSHKKSCT